MPSAGFYWARVLSELLFVEQCRQLPSAQQSSEEQIRCLFTLKKRIPNNTDQMKVTFYWTHGIWNIFSILGEAHLRVEKAGTKEVLKKDDRVAIKLYVFSTSLSLLLLLLLLSRFSGVQLCATPETAAHQAPSSLGFFRQEHWSGLPFPSPMPESEKWKWSRSFVSNS